MIGLWGVLYSVPPVRLRRFPVVPNGVIGFMVLLSFLAGVSFTAEVTGKTVFGGLLLWALFLLHSLEKDLGQEEGDAANGVQTLPVILGSDTATKVTSALGLSAFIFPAIFVFVFDLHWVLYLILGALLLLEAFFLRRLYYSQGTSASGTWYLRIFGVFVALQLVLLAGALF